MNFLKKLLEFILVCCVLHIASAQNPSNFRFYNSQNGLFANKIRQISQDSLGFMWLATNKGLLKYDGFEFTNFEHIKDVPELNNSEVITIFKDHYKNLWIGCDKALILYNFQAGLFKKITFPENFQPFVNSITEDDNGCIWVTTNKGLFKIDNGKAKTVHTFFDRIDHVLFLKRRKALLLISYNSIAQIDSKSLKITTKLKYCKDTVYTDNIQTCIEEDAMGNVWIGKYNGDCFNYNLSTNEIFKYDLKKITGNQSAIVNSIYSDNKGKLWFCIDESGIYSFDFKNKTFDGFLTPKNVGDQVRSFKITTMFKDVEENLWIASENNSLILTNQKFSVFKNLSLNSISKTQIVSSVLEDSRKNIWVGTDGDGLYLFDSNYKLVKVFKDENSKTSLPNNAVLNIFEDSQKTFGSVHLEEVYQCLTPKTEHSPVFNTIHQIQNRFRKMMLERYPKTQKAIFGFRFTEKGCHVLTHRIEYLQTIYKCPIHGLMTY